MSILPPRQQKNDEGAALITALIIVAVMAAAVVAVMDTMRFSMRVSSNVAQRDQAQLLVLGAEKLATETISRTRAEYPAGTAAFPVLDEWTRNPFVFPIDGGQISGQVIDSANCFNLNAVVRQEDGRFVVDKDNAKRLELLLEYSGVNPPQSTELVSALVDWMDGDASPGYGGAEDPDYMALAAPYRTSESLLYDVSEIKAVAGFNAQIYHLIRPQVCALPEPVLQPLNLNTLNTWNLPLLVAYLGGGYEPQDLESLILERPVGGFSDVREFFSRPVFGESGLQEEQRKLFALSSFYYALQADIQYYGTQLEMTSIVKVSESGQVDAISRQFGGF